MFSWEIDELLNKHNCEIDSDMYIMICNTSPQITYVKFDPDYNDFQLKTNDGYNWSSK